MYLLTKVWISEIAFCFIFLTWKIEFVDLENLELSGNFKFRISWPPCYGAQIGTITHFGICLTFLNEEVYTNECF